MNWHRAATRVGKNDIHSLALKALNENFRAVHDFATIGRGVGFFRCGFFGLHKAVKGARKLVGTYPIWRVEKNCSARGEATDSVLLVLCFGNALNFLLGLKLEPIFVDFLKFPLEHFHAVGVEDFGGFDEFFEQIAVFSLKAGVG